MVAGALVVTAVATMAETYASVEASQQQAAAVQTEANASKLQATQQDLQRAQQVNKVTSAQTAQAAVSGIAPDSESLSAIQTDTFNQFAQDQQAANMEESLKQDYFKTQLKGLEWQEVGSVAKGVSSLAGMFAKSESGSSF